MAHKKPIKVCSASVSKLLSHGFELPCATTSTVYENVVQNAALTIQIGAARRKVNMKCEACGKRIDGEVRLDSEGYSFHRKCFNEVFAEELAAQSKGSSAAHRTTGQAVNLQS